MIYQYWPYTLTLRSPVIISAPGGDPNSSLTLSWIPGAALRGAVAAAFGDPGGDCAQQRGFHDLVLGGRVRFLNAYPAPGKNRCLPRPLALRQTKNSPESGPGISVFDLAAFHGNPAANDGGAWPAEQLVDPPGEFLELAGSTLTLVRPAAGSRLHHQRDRARGRAWKDKNGREHGTIFFFESLDAGQSFRGLVQVRGESGNDTAPIAERVKSLAGETILIGRSRRAGYGGTAGIAWGDPACREVEDSGPEFFRPISGDLEPGAEFRLLLLAPCVARDPETGQVAPGALPVLLEKLLNQKAEPVRRRWAFDVAGGFNRKWRLETPQAPAAAAGSLFVFRAKEKIPVDFLRKLEHEGVGERREEGYGRILFLHHHIGQKIVLNLPDEKPSGRPAADPPELVQVIERRVLEAQVGRAIEETAATIAGGATRLPSASLLGRLRVPLRADPVKAAATFQAWLGTRGSPGCLRRPAAEQLARCRVEIDGRRVGLDRWLGEATGGGPVCKWLDVALLAQRYHVFSEDSARQHLEGKSRELGCRLADAVLAAMAVRVKLEETGDAD